MTRTPAYFLAAAIGLAAATAADAQQNHGNRQAAAKGDAAGPILLVPDQLKWMSVEGVAGLSETWLVGGSDKPGPYVVRRDLAQGAAIAPRRDPQTIFITVLSGEVYVGNDNEFDPASAKRCPAGTFVVIPGGTFHYIWARHTEAVFQEWGTFPAKPGAAASPANSATKP